jgi:antibiotic biosynthesis monooxygenase (ABM) superfamily enzyme
LLAVAVSDQYCVLNIEIANNENAGEWYHSIQMSKWLTYTDEQMVNQVVGKINRAWFNRGEILVLI